MPALASVSQAVGARQRGLRTRVPVGRSSHPPRWSSFLASFFAVRRSRKTKRQSFAGLRACIQTSLRYLVSLDCFPPDSREAHGHGVARGKGNARPKMIASCRKAGGARRGVRWTLVLGMGLGALGCDQAPAGTLICRGDQVRAGGQCLEPVAVALNTVGYLPEQTKRATYSKSSGGRNFVIRELEGDEVYEGQAEAEESGGELYIADFSEFEEPGEYVLEVGLGTSAPFRIAADIYRSPLDASMLGLYGQRCGVEVQLEWDGDEFGHAACHQDDGLLDYADAGTTSHKDGLGGWHDAGDYGKYTVNGAFAAATLLAAYEHFPDLLERREFAIPEQGGKLPDILDEAKVEIEWLLKMQFADGQASHKLTALNFAGDVAANQDRSPRYFTPAGTAATADLVAIASMAARVYEPFDEEFADRCLDAAKRGMRYLSETPENFLAPVPAMFRTGSYGDTNQADERLWAMVEYWETTGDEAVLEAFEAGLSDAAPRRDWDWADTTNLSLFTYVLSERKRDASIVQALTQAIVEQADDLVVAAAADPFGRALGMYYWGVNGVLARTALNLSVANQLEPNPQYIETIRLQVDHLLGRNPYGRSYVTGIGYAPPQAPHHRPSKADAVDAPWPGNLVGGPREGPDDWKDSYDSYETNEVAINWTAAMVYALVAAEQ